MLPDSHSIERRSLSFFFQDIALWPGRIWVLPQFVDVSLDLPGVGFIKALHIFLSLKRYRYFECHKTASLPIFFVLPLLDRFANPRILCCSLKRVNWLSRYHSAEFNRSSSSNGIALGIRALNLQTIECSLRLASGFHPPTTTYYYLGLQKKLPTQGSPARQAVLAYARMGKAASQPNAGRDWLRPIFAILIAHQR